MSTLVDLGDHRDLAQYGQNIKDLRPRIRSLSLVVTPLDAYDVYNAAEYVQSKVTFLLRLFSLFAIEPVLDIGTIEDATTPRRGLRGGLTALETRTVWRMKGMMWR